MVVLFVAGLEPVLGEDVEVEEVDGVVIIEVAG